MGDSCKIVFLAGLTVLSAMTVHSQYVNITVSGGVGFPKILDLYLIDDHVTWYTANEACSEEVPNSQFLFSGPELAKYTAMKIIEENFTTAKLLWVGLIKWGDDNKVYKGNGKCEIDNGLTKIIQTTGHTEGLIQCVVLNTSSMTYGLDDCYQHHPYICRQMFMDSSYYMDIFFNVSLSYDTEYLYKLSNDVSSSGCPFSCVWFLPCIVLVHDVIEGKCYAIYDNSSDFEKVHSIRLTTDKSSDNMVKVKKSKKVSLTYMKPRTVRERHEGPEYSCTNKGKADPITTSSSLEPVCYCTCRKEKATTEHDLQSLMETIKTALSLNKTELSSTKRKLTSANDTKPSSKAFGYIGTAIIMLVVCFIISGDLVASVLYIRKMI